MVTFYLLFNVFKITKILLSLIQIWYIFLVKLFNWVKPKGLLGEKLGVASTTLWLKTHHYYQNWPLMAELLPISWKLSLILFNRAFWLPKVNWLKMASPQSLKSKMKILVIMIYKVRCTFIWPFLGLQTLTTRHSKAIWLGKELYKSKEIP